MRIIRTLGVLAAATFAVASTARAQSICDRVEGNLVANCGFETGDFTSWRKAGVEGDALLGRQYSGTYGAYFTGGGGSYGEISQVLATTAGASYNVSFWLTNNTQAPPGNQSNRVTVFWDGDITSEVYSLPDFDWTRYTVLQQEFNGIEYITVGNLVASSASTELKLSFSQNGGLFLLDDVEVTSTVPEPGTFGLLGLGLVGVGALRRRKTAN